MNSNANEKAEKPYSQQPHHVDEFVGHKIKIRRKILGMSQSKLGDAIGLTFQQVQKYERGTNRIGASRLYELSKVLKTPVAYFFEGLDLGGYSQNVSSSLRVAEHKAEPYEASWLSNKELLDLVKAYNKIQDPQLRKQILDFTRSLAQHFEESNGEEKA